MLPQWFHDTAEYILRVGLPNTLKLAAFAVIASLVIGIVLKDADHDPLRPPAGGDPFLHRVWRGLPDSRHGLHLLDGDSAGRWLPVQAQRVRVRRDRALSGGSAQVAEATRGAVRVDPAGAARGLRLPSASAGSADTRS